jgi:hypothetical protein
MTAEQSLVGALGCASWRSHYLLREHAALARVATVIRGSDALRIEGTSATHLNEVGITDTVLAAIWRFGPNAAGYAISSRAEAEHLGADIAIIHQPTSRILLYQAKLARHDDRSFKLKSPVTKRQLGILRRRNRIEIQGARYQITGRLALYQQDLTPYLGHCPPPFMHDMWWRPWEAGPHPLPATGGGESGWEPSPEVGREYFETVLARHGCSPSGVLAALVPSSEHDRVNSIVEVSTWPWEFDAHQWLRQEVPHSDREHAAVGREWGGAAPDFGAYFPTFGSAPPAGQAAGIANVLAERLRLPSSTKLHVIMLP